MATNKYPKGRGYTPTRPEARTKEDAKKLGLNPNSRLHGQEGTSASIRTDAMVRGAMSIEEYHRSSSAALKKTLERSSATPGKKPKSSVGKPRVAAPKKRK